MQCADVDGFEIIRRWNESGKGLIFNSLASGDSTPPESAAGENGRRLNVISAQTWI